MALCLVDLLKHGSLVSALAPPLVGLAWHRRRGAARLTCCCAARLVALALSAASVASVLQVARPVELLATHVSQSAAG